MAGFHFHHFIKELSFQHAQGEHCFSINFVEYLGHRRVDGGEATEDTFETGYPGYR